MIRAGCHYLLFPNLRSVRVSEIRIILSMNRHSGTHLFKNSQVHSTANHQKRQVCGLSFFTYDLPRQGKSYVISAETTYTTNFPHQWLAFAYILEFSILTGAWQFSTEARMDLGR